jgi:hypothetical protein
MNQTPTASEGRVYQFLSALPEAFDQRLAEGKRLETAIYAVEYAVEGSTLRIIPVRTDMPVDWNKGVIAGIFEKHSIFIYAYVDMVELEEQRADGTRATAPAVFAVATDGNAIGSICMEVVETEGMAKTGRRMPFPIESPVMKDWTDLLAPVHQT